jgi:mono/diheme cytochrome c family protein
VLGAAALVHSPPTPAAPPTPDEVFRGAPPGVRWAEPVPAGAARIERGRYLVTTSGCHDCHTPMKMGAQGPEPDLDRMLSGHPAALVMPPAPALPPGPWLVASAATNTAFAGPWGVSFTANLTPDRDTGLGDWSERDFVATIRSGRHLGRGREVLPPMPIPMYRHFSDADLSAMWAYLRTVPAVANRVPDPLPPASAKTAARP